MSLSLKDIAKKVGVSTSTVSKAINNRPGVSDEVRNKILTIIDEMNFQPKQRVGGLIKNDTINVNLLVRINQSIENDPFYSLITEGISKELQNYKSNLIYNVLRENKISNTMFEEFFQSKNIDGNILVGADFDNEFFDRISSLDIPTVLVDNMHEKFSSVNTDNYNGAFQAAKYLVDLGHKNIIFLSGPLNHKSINQRYYGYLECLEKHLDGVQPKLIECLGVSVEDGFIAIDSYSKKDFTAIFAANDKLAIGALKALKNKGYQIPKDVSIIGFDDIEWGHHTEPALSTVRIAKHQIGTFASQLFINAYNDKDMHQVDVKVSTKLIIRQSTGPLNA